MNRHGDGDGFNAKPRKQTFIHSFKLQCNASKQASFITFSKHHSHTHIKCKTSKTHLLLIDSRTARTNMHMIRHLNANREKKDKNAMSRRTRTQAEHRDRCNFLSPRFNHMHHSALQQHANKNTPTNQQHKDQKHSISANAKPTDCSEISLWILSQRAFFKSP